MIHALDGWDQIRLARINKPDQPRREEVCEPNVAMYIFGVRELYLVCKDRLVQFCHFVLHARVKPRFPVYKWPGSTDEP